MNIIEWCLVGLVFILFGAMALIPFFVDKHDNDKWGYS